MKAIVYNKKLRPFKLQLTEVEKPVPGPDEVLLKINSVSLNAADYRSMKMGIIPKKKIFGSAVSGTIESVGQNIRNFKVGDQVVGDVTDFGFGGLAEFAVAPEKAFVLKPSAITFDDAVTLPVAATTALIALRDKGIVGEGKNVLIVGSSGGVGTYALQLAKYFGGTVTAVCSTKNIDQTKALGADHVIDYTKVDFVNAGLRYDLILAINGHYPLLGFRRMLSPDGVYVMVGGSLAQIFKSLFLGPFLSFGGKKMKALSAKSDPKDLEFVVNLMAHHNIRAVIHKRFSLAEAAEAMDYLSDGHSPGKVVINVAH